MVNPIVNCPLEIVMEVFKEEYPGVEVDVYVYEFPEDMESHGFCEGTLPAGMAALGDMGAKIVLLNADIPYRYLTSTLVHELAHCVAPPDVEDESHGPLFRAAFLRLYHAYRRALLRPENQAKIPPSWDKFHPDDVIHEDLHADMCDQINRDIPDDCVTEEIKVDVTINFKAGEDG